MKDYCYCGVLEHRCIVRLETGLGYATRKIADRTAALPSLVQQTRARQSRQPYRTDGPVVEMASAVL